MSRRRRRRSFSILLSKSSSGEPGFESFDIAHLNKTKIGHFDRRLSNVAHGKESTPTVEAGSKKNSTNSLGVRRHLLFFEDDVLTNDRIVLLKLKLALLQALVLRRVVSEAGPGAGNESDVISHGTRGVSCVPLLGNDLSLIQGDFSFDRLDFP